jgi:predicted adenine nucleotide alpha hydrolase (AANH) superfamily ATPase
MIKQNYQKMMESQISAATAGGKVPTLLLHSCCAPCSSYVLEYLSEYFRITVYYYNPNITPDEEYKKRVAEQERLISTMKFKNPVQFIEGAYRPEEFFEVARGLEDCPEGGERCFACYRLRLLATAKLAKEQEYDFFTTTLSISPHKNAEKLNEIGQSISNVLGVPYLYADFKKREGYKRSIVLSAEYDLYRQNYCGCVFSKKER